MPYRFDLGRADQLEGIDVLESLHFPDYLDPGSLDKLISKINKNPTSNDILDRHVNSSTRISSTTSNDTSSPSVDNQINQPYRDFSTVPDGFIDEMVTYPTMKGRPKEAFPIKLHKILERSDDENYSSLISWQPHGRAFKVHNRDRFIESIMPQHFYMTRITSFQRQLNIYGFRKCTKGADKGGYSHELFLRGRPGLCAGIVRLKFKPKFNPESELNLYELPPVLEAHSCPVVSNETTSNSDHQELTSHPTTNIVVLPEADSNKAPLNNKREKVSKKLGRNNESNLTCIHTTKQQPLFENVDKSLTAANTFPSATSQMAYVNVFGSYSPVEGKLLARPCINNLSATTWNDLLLSSIPRHYLPHPRVYNEQSLAYIPPAISAELSSCNNQKTDRICNNLISGDENDGMSHTRN